MMARLNEVPVQAESIEARKLKSFGSIVKVFELIKIFWGIDSQTSLHPTEPRDC